MQLQQLKSLLGACRGSLLKCKNLVEIREIQMQKIHELKDHLEFELHRMYTTPKQADTIKQKIEHYFQEIDTLKENVKQIDHELDHLEENDEKTIQTLKIELIEGIKTQFPSSSTEFHILEQSINAAQKKIAQLEKQKKQIDPLFYLFKEGAQINLKTTILRLFLGSNPKADLSKIIQKAAKKAREISEDSPFTPFLKKFLQEAGKPWNKKLYSGHFSILFRELDNLLQELDDEITQTHKLLLQKEEALEALIERHC